MKAFLLDVDPVKRGGKSGVRLYVKTSGKKKLSKRVFAAFEPYFYLLPNKMDDAEKQLADARAFRRGREVAAKRIERVERSFAGKPVQLLKIFADSPSDVPALREVARKWGETFEDDVPFTRRFLIDSQLIPSAQVEFKLGSDKITVEEYSQDKRQLHLRPHLNTLAFDIETYNPLGIPNPKSDPCLMISYAFADDLERQGVLTHSKKTSQKKVSCFEDEKQMIEEFCEIVRKNNVDLLAGYNSDEFDLPYLIERSKATKANLVLGRDDKPISVRKLGLRRRARISGRMHFDAFVPISFLGFIGAFKFPRLTLGAVYKQLYGEEKLDTKKAEIWRAWDAGGEALGKLFEYALADAKACLLVTQKILPLEIELSKLTGLALYEVSRATPGQMVESLLMRAAFQRNELVPQKPGYSTVQGRQEDAIQGAYVKMPSPGVYENIAVFDFRSVEYNEPIVLIDSENQLQIRKIGEFVDEHMEKHGKASVGEAEVCNEAGGFRVMCFDENYSIVPKQLSQVSRHPNNTSLYRITTKSGRQITVTPNHSLFTLDKNGFKPRPVTGSELKPGDHVIVPSKTRFPEIHAGEISLIPFLRGAKELMLFEPVERKGSKTIHTRSVLKKLAYFQNDAKTPLEYSKEFSTHYTNAVAALNALAKENLLTKNKKHNRTSYQLSSAGRRFIEIEGKLARFRRYDGNSKEYVYRFEDVADAVSQLSLAELRNWKVGLRRGKQRFIPVVSLEKLAALLGWFVAEGCLVKSKKKESWRKDDEFQYKVNITPVKRDEIEEIKTLLGELSFEYSENADGVALSSKIFYELIRGMDCGTEAHSKKVPSFVFLSEENARKAFLKAYLDGDGHFYGSHFTCCTVSEHLANSLALLCMTLRDTSCTIAKEKPRRTLFAGREINASECYYLTIHGLSETKRSRTSHAFTIPAAFVKNHPFKRNRKILFKHQLLEWAGQAGEESLAAFVSSDLSIDVIAAVEQVQSTNRFVYDVGVNPTQNFVCGMGGIIAHNSLYPSIITSHNIDPYTMDCDCCPESKNLAPTGARFCEKKKGVIPETLGRVLEERFAIADRMKKLDKKSEEYSQLDARKFALKILANSFYGYLVYARSRYYSRESGEATTAWARQYIHEAISKAEEAGFKVLYADTDSCFLLMGDKTEKDALEFQKKINSELPGTMEFELEDFYPRGIFVSKKQGEKGAKKKYALINKAGAIKIRGFELVRRDWSGVARNTQRQVLEVLLKEGDLEKAKKIVMQKMEELREGNIKLEDLIIRTQLRKTTGGYAVNSPELSAVQNARARGVKVEEHSLVEYIITKNGKTISEKAQLAELAKPGDYDVDYYTNNQLLPAVLKILGALGVDEDELKRKGKQKGLGDWG